MAQKIDILAFAGSLRKGSYNKALLRSVREMAPEKMRIELFGIEEIPLFNADVEEKGDPQPVQKFKQAIRKSDGVLIATPEYNYGVAGVTKNAVDWASRPPKDAPLNKKPVGILGASPSITGTARAQSQLRQAFGYTNSYCMPQPEILVFRAGEKFDENGKLIHEGTQKFLGQYLESLYDWILTFK